MCHQSQLYLWIVGREEPIIRISSDKSFPNVPTFGCPDRYILQVRIQATQSSGCLRLVKCVWIFPVAGSIYVGKASAYVSTISLIPVIKYVLQSGISSNFDNTCSEVLYWPVLVFLLPGSIFIWSNNISPNCLGELLNFTGHFIYNFLCLRDSYFQILDSSSSATLSMDTPSYSYQPNRYQGHFNFFTTYKAWLPVKPLPTFLSNGIIYPYVRRNLVFLSSFIGK